MKIKDVFDRLTGATSAIQDLRDVAHGLRDDHQGCDQKRSGLCNALPPLADIVAAIERDVARAGAAWRAQHGMAILQAAADRLDVGPDGRVNGVVRGDVIAAFTSFQGVPFDVAALCALAPDAVRLGLTVAVRGVEYVAGPPVTERAGLIAEIDRRMDRIEREHAELVDEAERAGVTLQHIGGERARRIQAAQRRQSAEAFNAINRDAIRRGAVQPMPVE